MYTEFKTIVFTLIVSSLIITVGCSEGASGPAKENSLLNGIYMTGQLAFQDTAVWEFLSDVDRIQADGAGEITLDEYPVSTFIFGPYPLNAYVNNTTDAPGTDATGHVSDDGNIFTLIQPKGTQKHGALFMITSTGTGTTAFDGSYTGCMIYGGNNALVNLSTVWMDVTANGAAGTLDYTYNTSLGGSGSDTSVPFSITDGVVSITGGADSIIENGDMGVISSDGRVVMLTDYDGTGSTNDEGSLLILIKDGAAMDESELEGNYGIYAVGGSFSGTEIEAPWVLKTTLTADGLGIISGSDNAVALNGDNAYTVAADGTLVIPGTGYQGIVNWTGDIFVMVDRDYTASVDEEIKIVVGFRRWL